MAKALTVHRDRESTYQKFSERLFWHGMTEDIKESIKICKSWRRTNCNFSTHKKKQPDGHNCGPFAIAYNAETLDGRSPSEVVLM